MSLILGKEYCKLDTNGRLKFPVALKKQLPTTSDTRFVVRASIYDSCLELWTYESFQKEVLFLQKKLNQYNKQERRLFRKLTEGNIIELDSNDRFLIPMEQKSGINLGKDIVLISTGKFIEIWDAVKYENVDSDGLDYASFANERLGNIVEETEIK